MNEAFTGDIIEESLHDKSVLKDVNIVSTRVEIVTPKHKTPWLKQWTLHTIKVPSGQAEQLAEALSRSLDDNYWYVDYKNSSTHYVIYPNKIFKIDRSQPERFKPATAYGLALGIPGYQLAFSPNINS